MPHTRSAKKSLRKNEQRRLHNRAVKRTIKEQIKKVLAAASGPMDQLRAGESRYHILPLWSFFPNWFFVNFWSAASSFLTARSSPGWARPAQGTTQGASAWDWSRSTHLLTLSLFVSVGGWSG